MVKIELNLKEKKYVSNKWSYKIFVDIYSKLLYNNIYADVAQSVEHRLGKTWRALRKALKNLIF